jgi:hypothetical protein
MIRRHCTHIALILAVVYLALGGVAAFCVSSHDIQHSPITHHSKKTISHSSLCSFACQAGSKTNTAGTTQTTLLTLTLVVMGIVFPFFAIPVQAILKLTPARGPPIS